MIDLRSDTFTTPCAGMRKAMAHAETGDDCYGEDPTVRQLEEHCADLFGKESAVFMPTGTMSNQVAIKTHTTHGDEVFIHARYHVYYYESAPSSAFSGVHFGVVSSEDGAIHKDHVHQLMSARPRGPLYAKPSLLILENSVCSLGGRVFTPTQLIATKKAAESHHLRVHLDGARILNACIATDSSPRSFGQVCDSVSMCFAKGLGAPMGSILAGSKEFIDNARMYRKWFGGAMHQSGIIAAACLYGLQHIGTKQIAQDHCFAEQVYQDLTQYVGKFAVTYHRSNMILIAVNVLGLDTGEVVRALKQQGILVLPWDAHCIRLVFHRGVTQDMISDLGSRIAGVLNSLSSQLQPIYKPEHMIQVAQ